MENDSGKVDLETFTSKLIIELVNERCRLDVLVDFLTQKEILNKEDLNELFEENYEEKFVNIKEEMLQQMFKENE